MDAHTQADIELLRQYAESGSAAAFAAVVARHADFVFAVALRQTRSRELAEDVTQAVFIVLARRARGLRDGASVAAFLHQTTVFAAKNALRAESRRRRHEKQAAIHPAVADASTQNEPMDEGAVAVDCGVAQLRDGDRQFLMLHYFDGLNVDDLAARLKISHEAARKRLHRALARLREHLNRNGGTASSAALPATFAALAHPATVVNSSSVASAAVAGGVDGRAFALAHQLLLNAKLLFASKAVAVVAVIAIVVGAVAIPMTQPSRGRTATTAPATLPNNIPSSRPAAGATTVVEYARIFSEMRETVDLRSHLDNMNKELSKAVAGGRAEIARLKATRDSATKGSPEYVQRQQELAKTTAEIATENRAQKAEIDRYQITAMITTYQKMEIAVTMVGAKHSLKLLPAPTPAYPTHYDGMTLTEVRNLLNSRMLSCPQNAPDLSDEVLDYLNTHDIRVPGIGSPTTTQISPP